MTTTSTKIPAISAETIRTEAGRPIGLRLTFAHGESLMIDQSMLTEAMHAEAVWHGVKQKLVDAAAISRNPDTGRSATTEDKAAAVREVFERIIAGEWNKRREGGAGGNNGLLLSALIRLYAGTKTEAQLREYVDGLTEKEQAAIRATAKVAPIIAAIKAERDAKRGDAIDGDALLAGLDDAPV
jgi:hypothetical protein